MSVNFNEQLQQVQAGAVDFHPPIQIDLSIAAIDKKYSLAGNYFYIFDAPDQMSYIDVKFNATNQPAISWVKQTGIQQPFTCLYITTPAGQSGTMTIIAASVPVAFFGIIDNRSATSESLLDILNQLQGDITPKIWDTEKTVATAPVVILAANTNRKGCIIQAKSGNTGIIYLGFDGTVTQGKWFAQLQTGAAFSIDDYQGAIYAISSYNGSDKVGFGEW